MNCRDQQLSDHRIVLAYGLENPARTNQGAPQCEASL